MVGLRQKKKSERERRIVDAAERQFRLNGYNQTKMDDVAMEAEVSVGTVYNYFESKSDLLLRLVTMHDDVISAEIDALVMQPPDDVIDGVCGVLFAITRHSLARLGRENWRHLVGMSIIQRHSVLGTRFAELNKFLLERIIRMLQAMQKRRKLSPDCDIKQLGDIVFRIEGMLYIELVSNDDMTFEMYKSELTKDVRFVLRNNIE